MSKPLTQEDLYKDLDDLIRRVSLLEKRNSTPLPGGNVGPMIIQEDGATLPTRNKLNFGSGITAADAGSVADSITITVAASSSGYTTVRDEGVNLTPRAVMDFGGRGVTASDLAGRTFVNIPGISIFDETTFLTYRNALVFKGVGVTAADNGATQNTEVTIPGVTFQDEGASLTVRALVNFVGKGVTVTDVGGKTQISVPGHEPSTYIQPYSTGAAGQFKQFWRRSQNTSGPVPQVWIEDGVWCHLIGEIEKYKTLVDPETGPYTVSDIPVMGEDIMQLPVGFTPGKNQFNGPVDHRYIVATSKGSATIGSFTPGYVYISSTGLVSWYGGFTGTTWCMSLEGISFRIDNT